VRAIAWIARLARRSSSRASSGASVATTIMHEPSAEGIWLPTSLRCGDSSRQTGTPPIVRRPPKFVCTSTPTVQVSACINTRRDAVPIPPFQPNAIVPVPAPTEPSATGPAFAERMAAINRRA
jgi:hypothetical protein